MNDAQCTLLVIDFTSVIRVIVQRLDPDHVDTSDPDSMEFLTCKLRDIIVRYVMAACCKPGQENMTALEGAIIDLATELTNTGMDETEAYSVAQTAETYANSIIMDRLKLPSLFTNVDNTLEVVRVQSLPMSDFTQITIRITANA